MGVPIFQRAIFAGRRRELAFFLECIAGAGDGAGSTTLVSGPAGCGKSRLVAEVAVAARAAGAMTVSGGNYASVTAPFGPFVDILRELLAVDPELAPQASAERVPFERLLGIAPDAAPPSQWDRRNLFAIVAAALDRTSARTPLLLVLEDMHRADPESVELLQFLATYLEHSRVAIVATVLDEDGVGDRGEDIAATLARLPNVVSVVLEPLDDAAAREVVVALGRDLDAPLVDEICRRGEGHPLFLEELVRNAERDGSTTALPHSIAHATRKTMAQLDATETHIVETAALLGRISHLADLLALCGEPRDRVIRAVRHARDIGVLDEEGAEAFRFRHELVRVAIYDGMLATERAALHVQIADRIEANDTAPARAAHHYGRAGHAKKAATHAERAGDHAASLAAHASARDRYREALESGTLASEAASRVREKLAAESEKLRLHVSEGAQLTKREAEVAELIRRGLSNRAIADVLVLSERTVEHHVAAIFAKTGVHTRAEFLSA